MNKLITKQFFTYSCTCINDLFRADKVQLKINGVHNCCIRGSIYNIPNQKNWNQRIKFVILVLPVSVLYTDIETFSVSVLQQCRYRIFFFLVCVSYSSRQTIGAILVLIANMTVWFAWVLGPDRLQTVLQAVECCERLSLAR